MGAVFSRRGSLRAPHAPAMLSAERYAFDLADEENWLEQLKAHGFVVIRGVANADKVRVAKDLLWEAIRERFGHTVRDDPVTWNFPLRESGISPWLAQSAGAWAVRGWPGVKQAFARIWETEDLIVSMDSVLLWRPWWIQSEWRPSTEGLHLDQNPFNKPALECIQGMVPLLPVTDTSGGLQVVPDSHLDEAKADFKQTHLHMRSSGDWCPCDDEDLRQRALLLHAAPGDLVLWDSRTVHGGLVGTGKCDQSSEGPAELARLSVTVSMTPRSWASDIVLERRHKGFTRGESFNHVPHEAGTSGGTVRAPVRRDFRPPALTDAQLALL
mmetsp:Transcript_117839/g.293895  ORF Transcript_117839/g.293895 Transcript_117839/m.293895 type:complete len:327 (-) Transcript_117839:109-1089(-)|eukprot:CAMPEP_0115189150 /NCGR_PEP_ID=MMETSP0270-20121206/11372_1 /TAXON_ID=71861 /ORGANISM="Scrippsiella trochoidea, Strain CCMP3099" /LENGTH=326 /DNA_ID=CAMNT_0002602343 /DNA_START=73 /DNA_END=1053 /DNA_ORIENTATION=-